eukprot:jgi/Psemu1/193674/e_gw1.145.21.1
MSGGVKKLLQRWLVTRPLPYLKQGSTLSIRSQLQTDLRIRSHWRDDGQLSFLQQIHLPQGRNDLDDDCIRSGQILLSRNEDKMTSLGREDPHFSIDVLDRFGVEHQASNEGNNSNPATTLLPLPSPTTVESGEEEECNLLTIDVPDKINLDCDLSEGGSIFVENKIEGDVRLKTAQGNISVKKLRGHHIELESTSSQSQCRKGASGDSTATPSFIFVSEGLESQSLRLVVNRPSVDRIRAKRIHAKKMEILVGVEESAESAASSLTTEEVSILDDDDSGAICDISSLYIIGDATVDVQQPAAIDDQDHRQRQAVRIKSHHGHIHVQVSGPKPDINNELTGEVQPLVDLGGVNGSCEVFVSRPETGIKADDDDWTACHVHFDSIAPDSVNLIHTNEGNVHVTVDRKVESDIRLLSPPINADVDTEILLLEDNEDGSLADEVTHMLQEIEEKAVASSKNALPNISRVDSVDETNRIKIETQAFTSRERAESDQLQYCEFVDGWIENTTSEPDSRFDRKIRGNSSGGKISLDGAQNQALHGFVTEKSGTAEDGFARPFLAVSSSGKIVLETLSWLGNIARRYGLDESRNDDDLGRQATRRKGLGRLIPKDK